MEGTEFNIKNVEKDGWFNLVIGLLLTIVGFIMHEPVMTFLGGMCIMIWIANGFIKKDVKKKKKQDG